MMSHKCFIMASPGEGLKLEAGMIFTIEPMINAGKKDIKVLPDNWTVVTKDRSLSAQWEHTILVTNSGYEVLTVSKDTPTAFSRLKFTHALQYCCYSRKKVIKGNFIDLCDQFIKKINAGYILKKAH